MYYSENIVKNVDIIRNTFEIYDSNGTLMYIIDNDKVRDINLDSSKTKIRIFFKDSQPEIILETFGDVINITNCLIVLKKVHKSLKNKHYVDVLNYTETLLDRTDFYHYYDPMSFIYRVDANKEEVICTDIKNVISVVLHPNPTTIIQRKKTIVYVTNGVTGEETIFKFTNIENAVKGVEALNDAFYKLGLAKDNNTHNVFEYEQTAESSKWIIYYGGTPLAGNDQFSVSIWDDNNYLIEGDVNINRNTNVVTITFDRPMTGIVQLIR